MTWPTGAVNTANTDASTDSPANARADFLDLEQKVNQIIAHGAPVLQAGTQTIDGSKTFSSSLAVPNGSASGHAVNKGQMDAADGLRLLKSSNLSDLANAAAALANLDGVATSAFTGGNQSIGGVGYQKLPGGLIIQWGFGTGSSSGGLPVSFPISFPTNCASLVATSGNNGSSLSTPRTYNITTGGFSIAISLDNGSTVLSYASDSFRWIAIGY